MKTITLPPGQRFIQLADVADLIAIALMREDERLYYSYQIGFEIMEDVRSGELAIRRGTTKGKLPPTVNEVGLLTSVIEVEEFRRYVAGRGLSVVVSQAHETAQSATQPPTFDSTAALAQLERHVADAFNDMKPIRRKGSPVAAMDEDMHSRLKATSSPPALNHRAHGNARALAGNGGNGCKTSTMNLVQENFGNRNFVGEPCHNATRLAPARAPKHHKGLAPTCSGSHDPAPVVLA